MFLFLTQFQCNIYVWFQQCSLAWFLSQESFWPFEEGRTQIRFHLTVWCWYHSCYDLLRSDQFGTSCSRTTTTTNNKCNILFHLQLVSHLLHIMLVLFLIFIVHLPQTFACWLELQQACKQVCFLWSLLLSDNNTLVYLVITTICSSPCWVYCISSSSCTWFTRRIAK